VHKGAETKSKSLIYSGYMYVFIFILCNSHSPTDAGVRSGVGLYGSRYVTAVAVGTVKANGFTVF
jgi:hypothetical protein